MFSRAASSTNNDDLSLSEYKRRKMPRRASDRCVTIIDGQMYPVENWSSGGMLIMADERLFANDQKCVFTLKFKLRDEVIEVDHKAKVIRKSPQKVALEFLPLNKSVQTNFQKVVDDYVAQNFAESQTKQ